MSASCRTSIVGAPQRQITPRAWASRHAAALMLAIVSGPGVAAEAADVSANYERPAPMDAYLEADTAAEIALARSAAPPSVSNDAEIRVLSRTGYVTAASGKNGFVCIVERSWGNGLDDGEFWNPKIRAPICFNASSARTVLPAYLERTRWFLAGVSKSAMLERTKAEIASGAYPSPEAGAMCFMMSKQGYLADAVGHAHPHLMFFVAGVDVSAWGANLPGSPVAAAAGYPEPVITYFISVSKWSDGSSAMTGMH